MIAWLGDFVGTFWPYLLVALALGLVTGWLRAGREARDQ